MRALLSLVRKIPQQTIIIFFNQYGIFHFSKPPIQKEIFFQKGSFCSTSESPSTSPFTQEVLEDEEFN